MCRDWKFSPVLLLWKSTWLCRVNPLLLEQTWFSELSAQPTKFFLFWSEQIFSVKSYFPCYRTQETACSTIPGCFWSYQLQRCSDDVTLPEKLVLHFISPCLCCKFALYNAKRTWSLRRRDVKDMRENFKRSDHKTYKNWNV